MPNNVKIVVTANPAVNFASIFFKIYVDGAVPYVKQIFKSFVLPALPEVTYQVTRGTTLAETVTNLYNNLMLNDADSNCTFVKSGNEITVVFSTIGSYECVKLEVPAMLTETPYNLVKDYFIAPELPVIGNFNYDYFKIKIIDTYENDLSLVEEFTQITSPKLTWDAGDDLYASIMASKLEFNMMVTGSVDAKFKHLFTGDERRYLVKVFFVNDIEVESLCWQGYLLPDQFSEPYKNGVNFVEFTATDMIGSLKGKYLEPWYYFNRLPIGELIATILKMTGLDQEIIVKPSIIPSVPFTSWRDINVPLETYFDGKKYKDVYEILNDVLQAQGLTIYSYKEFWWIEGITRKRDASGPVISLDVDGNVIAASRNFIKSIQKPLFERDVPVFSGVTPWKSVNVNVDAIGEGNVFSDSVVEKEIFLTTYYPGIEEGQGELTGNAYRDSLFNDWQVVGCPYLDYRPAAFRLFLEKLNVNYNFPNPIYYGYYTEQYALANYLKCPERPYLIAGKEYELTFEARVSAFFSTNPATLQEQVDAGLYDRLFRFNMLINNVSILNNVPTLTTMTKFRYQRNLGTAGSNDYDYDIDFKVAVKFKLNVSGNVEFRFLHAVFYGISLINHIQYLKWKSLKVSSVEGYDEKENLVAIRPINYTQNYDADLNFTCSTDPSVKNSFGIGFPINQRPYLYTIPRYVNPAIYNDTQIFPTGLSNLKLQTFRADFSVKDALFVRGFRKAVFKETVSGVKTLFGNLWVRIKPWNEVRFGYLLSYTGSPLLPKTFYDIQTIEPSDVLKYMEVQYPSENYQNREKWRLYHDLPVVNESYAKTYAKAIHSVQSETLYRLEARAFDLIFPDMLVGFNFDGQERQFIPTTLTLDLTAGKTQIVATEAKYNVPNDLTYE